MTDSMAASLLAPPPSRSMRSVIICIMLLLHLPSSALSLSSTTAPRTSAADHASSPSSSSSSSPSTPSNNNNLPRLSGDWSAAKQSLRNPSTCVASVPGLDRQLQTLQQYFCGDDAPLDLDLRMRVRCKNNAEVDDEQRAVAYEDCAAIYNSVMMGRRPISTRGAMNTNNPPDDENTDDYDDDNDELQHRHDNNPCISALEELARGMASLADGPLEATCTDVHARVVCASDYRAVDPMFHTDKCPLRGYVTLTGPGTEYADRTCSPWEYAALRSAGAGGTAAVGGGGKGQNLKMANELEFIVMKGDLYEAPLPVGVRRPSVLGRVWNRSSACVHRSPPGASSDEGRRRVILSLDLADGKDDREWYEISRKRGWRSGMTQRKSRLVS